MARLGRTGRILKWAGLAVSALIVLAWAISIPWDWLVMKTWIFPETSTSTSLHCLLGGGSLSVVSIRVNEIWPTKEFIPSPYGPTLSRFPGKPVVWMPDWHVSRLPAGTTWYVDVPLWIPFLVVGLPTAVLCRRDRRIPPGHCQSCGYDLTGNVSGVCPECGVKR